MNVTDTYVLSLPLCLSNSRFPPNPPPKPPPLVPLPLGPPRPRGRPEKPPLGSIRPPNPPSGLSLKDLYKLYKISIEHLQMQLIVLITEILIKKKMQSNVKKVHMQFDFLISFVSSQHLCVAKTKVLFINLHTSGCQDILTRNKVAATAVFHY